MSEKIFNKFVKKMYKLGSDNFSKDVYLEAKNRLLDYTAVTLAGASQNDDFIKKFMIKASNSNYKVIGTEYLVSLHDALIIDGFNSHYLELDDGSRFGAIHPGAPIISSIIGFSRLKSIDGKSFLNGVITGYETSIRLAKSILPSHYKKGFHPTATCGLIGSIMGICVALKLDYETTFNAISIGMTSVAGTLKVVEDSSTIKPYNVGRSTSLAVDAVRLAQSGLIGPRNPFYGSGGFLEVFSDGFNEEELFNDNEYMEIQRCYIKIYPACRHAHSVIDSIMDLRERSIIDPKSIQKVNLYLYNGLRGKHDHKIIESSSSAKMSIPYCAVAAILFDDFNIQKFDEFYYKSDEVIILLNKVNYIESEYLTKRLPKIRGAIVEILFNDGTSAKLKTDYPKGSPENMIDSSRLIEKFNELVEMNSYIKDKKDKIKQIIYSIDEMNVVDLFNQL